MGFLDNATIGFGDVTVGGGSNNNPSQNPNFIFKETSSTLLITEKSVASRNATSDIEYTLPNKDNVIGNSLFKIVNMNADYTISVIDAQDSNIDDSNPFIIGPNTSISLILDKENLTWKIVNGV
jgi:hypothetical protein